MIVYSFLLDFLVFIVIYNYFFFIFIADFIYINEESYVGIYLIIYIYFIFFFLYKNLIKFLKNYNIYNSFIFFYKKMFDLELIIFNNIILIFYNSIFWLLINKIFSYKFFFSCEKLIQFFTFTDENNDFNIINKNLKKKDSSSKIFYNYFLIYNIPLCFFKNINLTFFKMFNFFFFFFYFNIFLRLLVVLKCFLFFFEYNYFVLFKNYLNFLKNLFLKNNKFLLKKKRLKLDKKKKKIKSFFRVFNVIKI